MNKKANTATSVLTPLYNPSRSIVPGFPATVGYLAHLGTFLVPDDVYG